jgi:hypothetical protein
MKHSAPFLRFVFAATVVLVFVPALLWAQSDSTWTAITFSGYAETYYAYDFGRPYDHGRPGFAYSFNRHNEVNLNFGMLKAACNTDRVRGNLALMAGTYANANLAAEPGVLRNLYEANVGVKISRKHQLWIDAGIFPAHIGFESAVGRDCWNLTRSIMADNSPYFESGAKITYTSPDQQWWVSGLLLNGWQRIQRVPGNQTPALGHQLTWKPNERITLNSSSFVGNDQPDSLRQMRYFHDFYAIIQATSQWGILLAFDVGTQQTAKNSSRYNRWWTSAATLRYTPVPKINLALRGEYYSDPGGVIVVAPVADGFRSFGYSLNVDYQAAPNVLWRIEGRGFTSKDLIFHKGNRPDRRNQFVTTSLSVAF